MAHHKSVCAAASGVIKDGRGCGGRCSILLENDKKYLLHNANGEAATASWPRWTPCGVSIEKQQHTIHHSGFRSMQRDCSDSPYIDCRSVLGNFQSVVYPRIDSDPAVIAAGSQTRRLPHRWIERTTDGGQTISFERPRKYSSLHNWIGLAWRAPSLEIDNQDLIVNGK